MVNCNINIIEEMPKGYRFVPNDEQLLSCYLSKKVNQEPVPPCVIREMYADDFYLDPPSFYGDKAHDERGFFFLLFDEPYSGGKFKECRRVGNGVGTWKPDGRYEVPVSDGNGNTIGYKIGFKYFPDGTDQSLWTMLLYRLSSVCSKAEKWVLGRLVQHRRTKSSCGTCSSGFDSGSSRATNNMKWKKKGRK